MARTRRAFLLSGAAATLGTASLAAPLLADAKDTRPFSKRIARLFADLPGDVAVKIVAPAAHGKPGLRVALNSSSTLSIGSAIKTFVLAEALRQADSPDVVATISQRQLPLDASVWNLDSATFDPPNLSGMVSERTALEAMILHSDNTATDMSSRPRD